MSISEYFESKSSLDDRRRRSRLWTPERDDLVRRRWIEGKTGPEIAAELGPDFMDHHVVYRTCKLKLDRHAPSGAGSKAWTEAELELLNNLVSEGKSASEIAAVVGKTRNAVIGRVHRAGLTLAKHRAPLTLEEKERRYKDRLAKQAIYNARRYARVRQLAPYIPAPLIDDLKIPHEQRRTIFTVGRDECRWIACDEHGQDFWCGGKTDEGKSYCPGHSRVVYREVAA